MVWAQIRLRADVSLLYSERERATISLIKNCSCGFLFVLLKALFSTSVSESQGTCAKHAISGRVFISWRQTRMKSDILEGLKPFLVHFSCFFFFYLCRAHLVFLHTLVYSLLITRNTHLSSVEDISIPKYLPTTAYEWFYSFWFLRRTFGAFKWYQMWMSGALGIVVF